MSGRPPEPETNLVGTLTNSWTSWLRRAVMAVGELRDYNVGMVPLVFPPLSSQDEIVADALFSGAQTGAVDPSVIGDNEDLERAVRLQLGVLDRWQRKGDGVGGWKVGLTSREGRASMGEGFHPFGYVLSSRLITSGSAIPRGRLGFCSVEPELCFTIGKELTGESVTRAQVEASVSGIAPAFEVKERRLPGGIGGALRIADNLKQWGIVVGAERPFTAALLDPRAEVFCDGHQSFQTETGEDIDDHFGSIVALCSSLSVFGISLEPGQKVITGSLTAAHLVEEPGNWRAHFPALGDVEVTFSS